MSQVKEKIKLNYEINDYDILDTHRDHAIVRAKIVNIGRNNNDTSFSKESIERAIPTLYNIPLIGIYSDIERDFKSHAKNDMERKQTYAIGTIPESCNAHFEKDMGMEYLVADIVVWKEYFPNFYDVIARNEEGQRQTTISMEISLLDYEKKDGVFDITDFSFNGICLLGTNVRPGIPNAGLRVVRFEEGKLDIEDASLYESLLKESNEELEILSKYSEKALSIDNGNINKKFEKGEVGNMSEKKETLAENLNEVISENKEEKVDPTKAEATETGAYAEKEKAEKKEESDKKAEGNVGEEKEKTEKGRQDEKKDMKDQVKKGKENNEKEEKEEDFAKEDKEKETDKKEEKVEAEDKEKAEKNACGDKEHMEDKKVECEEKEEDKPLTKSERKTYQANEKSYLEKIAYLKAELAAYKPYKAMYEQAEKEVKELLEYKEEAELNKLEQQKSEYFKTFSIADFDEEDRDDIVKKINDFNFSYQDFKAFMADKVQKYGMKSRFQNITDIINMYAENPDVASKYAESDIVSDEDKILDRYMNI